MAPEINGKRSVFTVPLFIDGDECIAAETFDVTSPASGKTVHQCSNASKSEALAAVESAARAFPSWRKTTPSHRRNIFLRAADIMERRSEELAAYMKDETGAAQHWADFNLATSVEFLRDIAGRIATVEGSLPATANENRSAMVVKEPFGVVLAMSPWNAPYILGMRSVAYPMAAGNTVVAKASELSPRVMWGIVSCFAEAGLPKGVLNMIVTAPSNASSVTSALIGHRQIKKINFTGSTVVGRIIAKLAGENLKPVLLELGGKAPAIVWEDADLDHAALHCAIGALDNAGQICMCTERILVHQSVRAAFEEKLKAAFEKICPSDAEAPLLISSQAVAKNKKLIEDAVEKGASIVSGNIHDSENLPSTRMRPIILSGVTTDMDIYQTESFGPSVSLFSIDSEEEALRIANDTEYGLTSAVFTQDLRRAFRFAREIETGAVHVNSMTIHDEPGLPHGGAKASGYGRFNASSLEDWVRTKTITFPM